MKKMILIKRCYKIIKKLYHHKNHRIYLKSIQGLVCIKIKRNKQKIKINHKLLKKDDRKILKQNLSIKRMLVTK